MPTGLSVSEAVAADDEEVAWIVSADEALEIVDQHNPTILDTRGSIAFKWEHLSGAVRANWSDFTPGDKSRRGELLADDDTLQTRLRSLGVSDDRPVLVVGSPPDNWGENGRIVWMLRTLGHDRVALVDGGWSALEQAGADGVMGWSADPGPGDFTVDRQPRWSIQRDELRGHLASNDFTLVDTRTRREYDGATPHGESRAGHLPGAIHLHYKTLLTSEGTLKPTERIRSILDERGITSDQPVVAYCTGGVRSAWLVAVFQHLGYDDVRNYAGSTLEWASSSAEEYPLETD